MSLLGVGVLLRLVRDAWPLVKTTKASNKRVPRPPPPADESRIYVVGECGLYKEEHNVSEEEMRKID